MERKYDTFWPRFTAEICDGLIFLPLRLLNAHINDYHYTYTPVLFLWEDLYLLLRPAYTVWMHGKYGQTLGKIYCKNKCGHLIIICCFCYGLLVNNCS